ncbi:MAG: agmatinase [Firmicutes bacterium]|nr:agmatinase [Bacillota bacterium]
MPNGPDGKMPFLAARAGSLERPPLAGGGLAGEGGGASGGGVPGGGPRPAAIIGVPLDRTTSFRSGTAAGPAAVREASWSLETYSPALDGELDGELLYDLGDVALDTTGPLAADLDAIREAVGRVRRAGLIPVLLGGEHLLTLPAYQGVLDGMSGADVPAVLHFDAHADLRDRYEGERLSHATVMRRVAEAAGPWNIYQFGVRSGDREEILWGRANVNRVPGTLPGAVREALRLLAGRRVWCSVDVDVLDPAHAPGTGNPEPGGPSAADLLDAVTAIGSAAALGPHRGGIDLVGFDLVEVSPPLDPSGRTAVVAAKIIRELLIAYALPVNGAGREAGDTTGGGRA